jgi:hypothetical protein
VEPESSFRSSKHHSLSLYLSQRNPQCTRPSHNSLTFILILYPRLRLWVPSSLIRSGFPPNPVCFYTLLTHAFYKPCHSLRPWLDHSYSTCPRVLFMSTTMSLVEFLVLTTAAVKFAVFWGYRAFGGSHCLHLQGVRVAKQLISRNGLAAYISDCNSNCNKLPNPCFCINHSKGTDSLR